YSRLYFQPTDTTNGNDVLQAWEIYNMQLDASMVVMSSCESGYGEVHGTEGMLSLSRAFRYAGAASVVYTLWPVSDKSSAEVMHYFYRFLDKGMSRDEAMQQAKLTYLETSDPALLHPAFWAGYTVNGNVEKVKINPVNKKIYIGTGLILLLIVILLTKKIRSKES
ncbi:MAG: CHAT domain-containing protein, partial [Bacteroidota bacterium]